MATVSGGDNLSKVLTDMAGALGRGDSVDVGFLAGATYPGGKSVAMIAAIQEFGAPSRGIPPRPYFRGMIQSRKAQMPTAIAGALIDSGYDSGVALSRVGEGVKGWLQQSIVDLKEPPLSPVTIARKGFDKPLIDTGHMLRTVDYRVNS